MPKTPKSAGKAAPVSKRVVRPVDSDSDADSEPETRLRRPASPDEDAAHLRFQGLDEDDHGREDDSDDDEEDEAVFNLGVSDSDEDEDEDEDEEDARASRGKQAKKPALAAKKAPKKAEAKPTTPAKPLGKGASLGERSGARKVAARDDEDDEDIDDGMDLERARIEADRARIAKLTNAWGSQKNTFYNADTEGAGAEGAGVDEAEAEAEEEEAALRLQKKKIKSMAEEDFFGGFASAAAQPPKSAGKKKARVDGVDADDSLPRAASTLLSSASKSSAGNAGRRSGGEADGTGAVTIRKDLSKLTDREKLQLILADAPELFGLLEEFVNRVDSLRDDVLPVLESIKRNDASTHTKSGIEFLEVKQQLLLSYITHIAFFLLLKAEGRPVRTHPVLRRLVHIRTLLERLKPIETRLQHQIDRLLKAASATSTGARAGAAAAAAAAASGALRPDVSSLVTHAADAQLGGATKKSKAGARAAAAAHDDDDDSGDGAEEDGAGAYVPVRRVAMHYEEDTSKAARAAKEEAKRAERLSKSRLLRELREEVGEEPEELRENEDDEAGERERRIDELQEKQREFEEENFVRLAPSKTEKKLLRERERSRMRFDPLAGLGDFAEIEKALKGSGEGDEDDEDDEEEGGGKGRAKRSSSKAAREALDEDISSGEDDDEDDNVANDAKFGGLDAKRKATSLSRSAQAAARVQAAAVGKFGGALGMGMGGSEDDEDEEDEDDEQDEEDGEEDEEEEGGRGARRGGDSRKRKRGSADALEDEDEDLYAAAVALAEERKARAAAEKGVRRAATAEAVAAKNADALVEDGKRAASRTILQNRGLMKYRKKEDRNPRVRLRHKAAKAEKRRAGQVRNVRTGEASRYGGEATGIRAAVTHSRKLA